MLIATNREVEVIAKPRGFDRGAEGGLATGLQLAQSHGGCLRTLGPGLFIKLTIDDDLAARLTDKPEHGQGTAQLPELLGLVAKAFEKVVDEREASAIYGRRIGLRLCCGKERERSIGLCLVLLHLLPVRFAVFEEREHL